MKVTKEDKKIARKMGIKKDEWELILKTSDKKSWAYRIAREELEKLNEGKI